MGTVASRYSGESDVVFGTIVSGRPASLPASDEMVGLFINTLPVRVRIDARRTSAWLAQLQLDLAQQEDYAHHPLADLQKFAGLPPGVPSSTACSSSRTIRWKKRWPMRCLACGSAPSRCPIRTITR